MALSAIAGFLGSGGGQAAFSALQQGRMANAQMMQEGAQTTQNIMTIHQQIRSDAMKQQAQRHQIRQETATKVNEMARETNLNRAKSATKIHNKTVQFIMS